MENGKFDLKAARAKIDAIDEELVKLFLERLDVAREVALAKKEMGGPINVPAREREILTKVSEAAGPANENAARLFFSTLFSISKARQRNILKGDAPLVGAIKASSEAHAHSFPSRAMVACCGAEGSYAQQATCRLVKVPTIVYFNDFEKVFEAVEKGLCPYGVLPVENSAAGSVAAVYDLMQKHSFHIARACRLKIDHVLLAPQGVKLEDREEREQDGIRSLFFDYMDKESDIAFGVADDKFLGKWLATEYETVDYRSPEDIRRWKRIAKKNLYHKFGGKSLVGYWIGKMEYKLYKHLRKQLKRKGVVS